MTRFECPECGAKIKANRDLRGRTIECPSCKVKTSIAPAPTQVIEGESRPAPSANATPSAIPPALPVEIPHPPVYDITGQESVYRVNPARRRFAWKKRDIAIACVSSAVLGTTLLGGMFAYSRMKSEPPKPKPVAQAPKMPTAPPAKKEPLKLSKDEIKQALRLWLDLHVQEITKKVNGGDSKIQTFEVKQIIDDRKIEWLWEILASVTVSVVEEEGMTPRRTAMIWKCVVNCEPDLKMAECWREVTIPGILSGKRNHFSKSEWIPEFREQVNKEWVRRYQIAEASLAQNATEQEKQAEVQRVNDAVSLMYKITLVELDGILKATD